MRRVRRGAVLALFIAGSLFVSAVALAGKPRLETRMLRAADMTLAKRTTLRASDLPRAWSRAKPDSSPNELPTCPGVDMDFSRFTITGEARSAFTTPRLAKVESRVQVFASKSDATGDFRKATTDAVLRCVSRWLQRRLEHDIQGAQVVAARVLSRPSVGERALLYRIVLDIPAGSNKIRFFLDVLSFQRGRSVVTLTFGSPKVPIDGRVALGRLLARRTR